jgi:hypothetical protein
MLITIRKFLEECSNKSDLIADIETRIQLINPLLISSQTHNSYHERLLQLMGEIQIPIETLLSIQDREKILDGSLISIVLNSIFSIHEIQLSYITALKIYESFVLESPTIASSGSSSSVL